MFSFEKVFLKNGKQASQIPADVAVALLVLFLGILGSFNYDIEI